MLDAKDLFPLIRVVAVYQYLTILMLKMSYIVIPAEAGIYYKTITYGICINGCLLSQA
jgi:hypothetical protein